MAENKNQAKFIKRLYREFPGCEVLKNDSGYCQGIPDLSFFFEDFWAFLEYKDDENAPYQPNQEYYLEKAANMSFSATVWPANEDEVIRAIQEALASRRTTCVSQS